MQLNQEAKTSLLQKYEPFIRKRVRTFYNKAPALNRNGLEDLMQEARCAFCQTIDAATDEHDLLLRAPCRIFDAMWERSRAMALVYIPHNQFQRQIATYSRVDVETQEMEALRLDDPTEDMFFHLMLDAALQEMSPDEQFTIRMRCAGYSNREIMDKLHIESTSAMSRLFNRARKKLAVLLDMDMNYRKE